MSDEKVFHTVKRDETLSYIAYCHNTTLEKIAELNKGIDKYCIYIGQKIRVK